MAASEPKRMMMEGLKVALVKATGIAPFVNRLLTAIGGKFVASVGTSSDGQRHLETEATSIDGPGCGKNQEVKPQRRTPDGSPEEAADPLSPDDCDFRLLDAILDSKDVTKKVKDVFDVEAE